MRSRSWADLTLSKKHYFNGTTFAYISPRSKDALIKNITLSRMLGIPLTLLILLALMSDSAFALENKTPMERFHLKTFKTHSRFSFALDSGVVSEWKDTKTGFEIHLKGIGLVDLGIPFGTESAWKEKIASVKDSRLKFIDFESTSDGLIVMGTWKFPSGNQAYAYPKMEHFDFREKSPPRFVMDFWYKKGPTLIQVKQERIKQKHVASEEKERSKTKKMTQRRLKIRAEKENITDLEKYCKEPLADEKDIFIPFHPVHEKIDFKKWFPTTTADSEYPYHVPQESTKEAEYLRIALDLYKKGKPALVVRTIEFLNAEVKDGQYQTDVKFLLANALIKLGLHHQADRLFQEIIVKDKESAVALHAGMYRAAKALEIGDSLSSLEHFLWLTKNFPTYRLNWVFHLGAAEALFALKQSSRAAKEYEWVTEHAVEKSARAMAGMRIGDVYMVRKQYPQALASYFKAFRYFKEEASTFSSIHLNRAEALYWLGEYDRAEKSYRFFLKQFSGNSSGWRASYRLSEIFGRRSGQVAQAVSRDWAKRTINEFPSSAGAVLARLRLAPCDDHGGMDNAAIKRFFENEVGTLQGNQEIMKERYLEFKNLAHARTLVMVGLESDAIHMTYSLLKTNLQPKSRKLFSQIFKKTFRKEILNRLSNGEKFSALSLFTKYSDAVLRDKEPIVSDFILKVANVASDLDLGHLAQRLVDTYREAKEASNFDRNLASDEKDIFDTLKESEIAYSEGRALWISSGLIREDEIRLHLGRIQEESPHAYRKAIILGLMEQKKGNFKKALEQAIKAEILVSKLNLPHGNRIKLWMAELHLQNDNLSASLLVFSDIESHAPTEIEIESKEPAEGKKAPHKKLELEYDALGIPKLPTARSLLIRQAEIHEKMKNWGKSAEVYLRAKNLGLKDNQIRFSYARALLRAGGKENKLRAIGELQDVTASSDGDFWANLAKDALENQ